jgi:hypothetical protein
MLHQMPWKMEACADKIAHGETAINARVSAVSTQVPSFLMPKAVLRLAQACSIYMAGAVSSAFLQII